MCSAFLFYVGFVFGTLSFVIVLFLFCFQSTKKHGFPCNSSDFESCWLRGSLFFASCFMFLFSFLHVLFVSCPSNEVVLLHVYVVCLLFL